MKKHLNSAKSIRYRIRHSRKQEEQTYRFKMYQKRKNRYNNSNPYKSDIMPNVEVKKHHKDALTVPSNFSLTENPEGVIKFMNHLNKLCMKKKSVFIDLKGVKNLGYETIVVLLSTIIKFKNKRIKFNGNYPDDMISRERLIKSKFFDVLFNNEDNTNININNLSGNGIYTHAEKNVNSQLSSKLIANASKSIWGEERLCKGVQRALIELMTNTNNHAGKIEGEKKWWVSVNCIEDEKKVVFSFVDFGKGIFNSLMEGKGRVVKWLPWYKKIIEEHDKTEVMQMILKGSMHKTVTGESHRGKGLPGIYESYKMNYFSKLYIISNDIFVDAGNDIYRKMNVTLNGTFVWWELSGVNKSIAVID